MDFQSKRANFSSHQRKIMRQKAFEYHRNQMKIPFEPKQSSSKQKIGGNQILRSIITNQQDKIESELIQNIQSQQFEIDDFLQLIENLTEGQIDEMSSIYQAIIGLRIILDKAKESDNLESILPQFLQYKFIISLMSYMRDDSACLQFQSLKILLSLSMGQNFSKIQLISNGFDGVALHLIETIHVQIYVQLLLLMGNILIDSQENKKIIYFMNDDFFKKCFSNCHKFQHFQAKQACLWLSCIYLENTNHNNNQLSQPKANIQPNIVEFLQFILPLNSQQNLFIYLDKNPKLIRQFLCCLIYLSQICPEQLILHMDPYFKRIIGLINISSSYSIIMVIRLFGNLCSKTDNQEKKFIDVGIIDFCDKVFDIIYPNEQFIELNILAEQDDKDQKGNILLMLDELFWLLCNLAAAEQSARFIATNKKILYFMQCSFNQNSSLILDLCSENNHKSVEFMQQNNSDLRIIGLEPIVKKAYNLLKHQFWFYTNLIQYTYKEIQNHWNHVFLGMMKIMESVHQGQKQDPILQSLQSQISECLTQSKFISFIKIVSPESYQKLAVFLKSTL